MAHDEGMTRTPFPIARRLRRMAGRPTRGALAAAAFAGALLAAALSVAFPMPARAQGVEDKVALGILPGWRGADGTHVAAVEIRLAPGWHTYWRQPGEVGVPPAFDWRGSRNLGAVRVEWPRPEVMQTGGATSFVYHDRVILPLIVTPARAGRPVELSGRMTLGICAEVCIPLELRLAADLPAAAARRDPKIAAALAERAFSAREAGVGAVRCTVSPVDGGMRMSLDIAMPPTGGREDIVVETGDPKIWAAPAPGRRSGGSLSGATELYHESGRAFALDRSGLRITVLGRDRAVEIEGCTGG